MGLFASLNRLSLYCIAWAWLGTSAQSLDSLRFFHLEDFPIWVESTNSARPLPVAVSPWNNLSIKGQKGFRSVIQGNSTQIEQDLDLKVEGQVGDSLNMGFYLHDKDLPQVGDGSTASLEELEVLRLGIWSPNQRLDLGQIQMPFYQGFSWSKERNLLGLRWAKTQDLGLSLAYGSTRGHIYHLNISLEEGLLGDYRLFQGVLLPGSESVYLDGQKLEAGKDYQLDAASGLLRLSALHLPRKGQILSVDFQSLESNSTDRWASASWDRNWGALKLSQAADLQLRRDSLKGFGAFSQSMGFKTEYVGKWLSQKSEVHLQKQDSLRSYLGSRWIQDFEIKPLPYLEAKLGWDQNDQDYLPGESQRVEPDPMQWALDPMIQAPGTAYTQVHGNVLFKPGAFSTNSELRKLELGPLRRKLWQEELNYSQGPWLTTALMRSISNDLDQSAWFYRWGGAWNGQHFRPQTRMEYWRNQGLSSRASYVLTEWGGDLWKGQNFVWSPNVNWRRYLDSADQWEQGMELSVHKENQIAFFSSQLRQTRLLGSKEWNWNGVAHAESDLSGRGLHLQQKQDWSLLKSQALRREYVRVPMGTGNVRYDSLQGRYLEGVEGGDYKFWGYKRDSLGKSERSFDLNSEWELSVKMGTLFGLAQGFLSDVDLDFKALAAQKNRSEFRVSPAWWGSLDSGVYEANRRKSFGVHWQSTPFALHYEQSQGLELWEGQSQAQDYGDKKLRSSFDKEWGGVELAYLFKEQKWSQSDWQMDQPSLQLRWIPREAMLCQAEMQWRSVRGFYASQNLELGFPVYLWHGLYAWGNGTYRIRQEYGLWQLPLTSNLLPYQVSDGFGPGIGLRLMHGLSLQFPWGLDLDLNSTLRFQGVKLWAQWDLAGRGYF